MTGTNDNRPSFQQMLTDSKKCEWDYVLVYKFDRFSRNKYETAIHKKTLRDNGVKLMSATEYLPDTPERIIIESMFEGYAEYYSAELSQKVKRGMKETRLKGNYTGGNLIYGYKVENKKVIVCNEQAEIVRYIYEQYSIGVFVKDIIADLNGKGIYNKGKPFCKNTIYNILKNQKYSGIYTFNGETFDNIYPQIVPTDLFEKVRKKIDSNKYGKQSVTVVYLLRNKMKCGYCGSSIVAESGNTRRGKTIRYYKCIGRKHNNGCTKTVERKELLESFVLNVINSLLTSKPKIEKITAELLKYQEQTFQENTSLKILQSEKRKCETSLSNIMKAIEQGVINNTTNKRMRELEKQIEDIETQLLIEKSKTSIKVTENDVKEYLSQALLLEPQLMINYLIKEIKLYDDKIEIYFNSPIMKGPDESRGLLIYTDKGKIKRSVCYGAHLKKEDMIVEFYCL